MSAVRYEYSVVSYEYKNRSPLKLKPTNRLVMRAPQVLRNPNLVLFGLFDFDISAIREMPIGDTHVDRFGDHWKRLS